MASSYSIEKSYDKRLKEYGRLMLIIGIIIEFLVVYFGLTYCAYISINPSVPFKQAILNILTLIPKKPLYFIPIDYSITVVLVIAFIVILLLFVMYAVEVKKIHHNINTMKGSAEWQNAIELTKRFAEFE